MSDVNLCLGDCLEVMKGLADGSVDAVVTDPPDFLPVNSYVGTRGKGYEKRTLADTSVLVGYFKQIFEELSRLIKDTGTYYVFCDGQSYPIFYQVMYPYTKYVRPIIWDKIVSYNGYTWRHQHELIAWGEQENTPRIPTGDGDIIKHRGVLQENRLHPAEKPVGLLEKLITKSVPEGGIVLDPFCGSASVGEACIRTRRSFIGIELEELYHAIAEKRIAEAQLQIRMPL